LAFALEVTGSNPLEDMCFFLILVTRGLYGGMRMGMSFARGGNEKDRIKNGNDRHGNGNGGRTGMTDYSCSLNSSRDFSHKE
jgi:hypothetical protein